MIEDHDVRRFVETRKMFRDPAPFRIACVKSKDQIVVIIENACVARNAVRVVEERKRARKRFD